MQSVLLTQGHDLFAGLPLLQKAVAAGLHAHDDIIQHREALHQLEVLMDHADAQGVGVVGIADLHFLPVLFDDALLRAVQSEQHAHQRGLARAVFAQQGVDLPFFQLPRNIVIGHNAGKALGDVQHFNGIWMFQVHDLPLLPVFRAYVYDLLYYIFPYNSKQSYGKRKKRGRDIPVLFFSRGDYLMLPYSLTVTAVVAGMAVVSLETVMVPSNMLFTSSL